MISDATTYRQTQRPDLFSDGPSTDVFYRIIDRWPLLHHRCDHTGQGPNVSGRRLSLLLPFLAVAFFFAFPLQSQSQTVRLFNINTLNFPDVQAQMIILNDSNLIMPGISATDLRLTEDGVQRSITSLSCPVSFKPELLNVVIVVDRSGSMGYALPNGPPAIEMTLAGVEAFVRTMRFERGSKVALTSFGLTSSLVQDFTENRNSLVQGVQSIRVDGGTDFNPPFFDSFSGAFALLSTRPDTTRRIVLFITDGEPSTPPLTNEIINQANRLNINIYSYVIGQPVSPLLQDLSLRTGGESHGEIYQSEMLAGLLQSVALRTQGASPCTIQWKSDYVCPTDDLIRDVQLLHVPSNRSGANSYQISEAFFKSLKSNLNSIWFGPVEAPNRSTRTIVLRAVNGDMEVTGYSIGDTEHFALVNWGGEAPPFTLKEGEQRTITLEFRPTAKTTYLTTVRFASTSCKPTEVLLTGGKWDPSAGATELRLLSPLKGDVISSCDSVRFVWVGVDETEPVRLQYSVDDGSNWITIRDSATGLRYTWYPPFRSGNYHFRITHAQPNPHLIETVVGGGFSEQDSLPGVNQMLVGPMGMDIRDSILFFVESGRNRVRAMDVRDRLVVTVAGTGNSGNGGDGGAGPRARLNSPNDVCVLGDSLFIADTENYQIRLLRRSTGIITRFAGNLLRDFSPDGTVMNTGSLMAPSSVATDGTYLYVTERDSARVRKIDLKTHVITTVAGGGRGTGFDSDGRPATEALLRLPSGLRLADSLLYFAEENGGRVRVVNLNTGIIQTFAGNGISGFAGDGDQAIYARIQPTDVAIYGNYVYIADKINERIRRVNVATGVITTFAGSGISGFAGDGGPAVSAQLSSPIAIAAHNDNLYISDRLNNRIRNVFLYRHDGLDEQGPIRVISPLPALPDTIDLGVMSVGNILDTLVRGVVCNVGELPFDFDSVRIVGANPNDFRYTGGKGTVTILPDSCHTLAFDFIPSATGIRIAEAVIYGGCVTPDTIVLKARGLPPCAIDQLSVIAVDSVIFGITPSNRRDTIVTQTICNSGSEQVTGVIRLVQNGSAFEIISGGGSFTILPGGCHEISIRFAPKESGRSMATIEYALPDYCGNISTRITGKGLVPATLVASNLIVATEPCPDGSVDTTLQLANSGETPLMISDIRFTRNLEGFSLVDPAPTPGSPLVILPGDRYQLRLRFAPVSSGPKVADLLITSNGLTSPTTLSLSGRRDSLSLIPVTPSVVIGRSTDVTYPYDTVVRYVNTGDRDITLSDGHISGADSSTFRIDGQSFPSVVPPGDTVEIPVQVLAPTEDRAYRGVLVVDIEGCQIPIDPVQLIHSGSGPLFTGSDVSFNRLICDLPASVDTIVVFTNNGGNVLTISDVTLADNNEGYFELLDSRSFSLLPGMSDTLHVRFHPAAAGSWSATVRFTTNTSGGEERVTIMGRRESVSFDITPTSLTFDPSVTGPNLSTARLMNTGTTPLTWGSITTSPNYRIVSVEPAVAPPGSSSIITIEYAGPTTGSPEEKIDVVETLCGVSHGVSLISDDASAELHLSVPDLAENFATPIDVPILARLINGPEPRANDTFELHLSFYGTTFFYESPLLGRVHRTMWNHNDGILTLVVSGRYGDRHGDTLAILHGRTILGVRSHTPLSLDSLHWSRSSVRLTDEDGSLDVLGLCFDPGLRLEVRPPAITKIRPNPARERVTIELHLEEWGWISTAVIDANGGIVRSDDGAYVSAGDTERTIDLSHLPDGIYFIEVRSPHGSDRKPVVLVR